MGGDEPGNVKLYSEFCHSWLFLDRQQKITITTGVNTSESVTKLICDGTTEDQKSN